MTGVEAKARVWARVKARVRVIALPWVGVRARARVWARISVRARPRVRVRPRVRIIRIGNCLPTLKGIVSLKKLYNLIIDAVGSS